MSAVAASWPIQTGVLGGKSAGSEGSDGPSWGWSFVDGGGEGEDVRSMMSGSAGRKGLGDETWSC